MQARELQSKYAPDGIREALMVGGLVVFLLVFGFGTWASVAELSGAVLSPGTLVVESNVKKVQHPTGGVVGEIHVKEGDRVAAGDLLIRLDETVTRANLQIVTNQLNEMAVRQSRLEAERDGRGSFDIPEDLRNDQDSSIVRIMDGERILFESRMSARRGQVSQLQERIAQLEKEIEGLEGQQGAKTAEIELIHTELASIEDLWRKNLIPLTRVTSSRREAARLDGERAQLIASIAQSRGKIAEIRLQVLQIDQDLRTEVTTELRDLHTKQAELNERRVAAEDQLKRIDLRAPQSETIHQMSAHTVGGVIGQGEQVMLIVPDEDSLVIECKIAPQDIDHVAVGQRASIRFTAFSQRTTPEFDGAVKLVSADLMQDPQSKQSYYDARISFVDSAANQLHLIPGMPAEVHIRTGERTLVSYLMKPLHDQIALALREK